MQSALSLPRLLVSGSIAGLSGGAVVYLAVDRTALSDLTGLLDISSGGAALSVHMAFSTVIGIGFALLLGRLSVSAGYSIMWGMTYALMWWFIAPLTLAQLAMGQLSGWSVELARTYFPLLPAYLVGYGIVLSLVYWLISGMWIVGDKSQKAGSLGLQLMRAILVGGVAGYLGGLVFGAWLGSAGDFPLFAALFRGNSTAQGRFVYAFGSFFLGAIYGVLYRREINSVGSSMAWGVAYGYLWWVLGELTIFPLWLGQGVTWSLENGRAAFPGLTGHLIWGLLLGVVYALVERIRRELFTESLPWEREVEGPGTRGIRALGLGLLAGVAGGVAYALALLYLNELPMLAGLAGSQSPVVGFVVALVVSALLGALYGLLFQRESYTYGTALIWGLVYGSVFFYLGRLWLIPVRLGLGLPWKLSQGLEAYPWLLAQLVYGATMAVVYQYLSRRHDVSLQSNVQRFGVNFRQTPGAPTPALWVLIVVLSVLLPVVLAP
jgi:uncharacterized membrane protein YagU involved in acid resistance